MGNTQVILVDQSDNPVGVMEKLEAHRKAYLHRAVSVFVVNSEGEWLLQRRANGKYHSGGLWTNTTCTHPYPGEPSEDAARRRLKEEMGIETHLTRLFSFLYRESLDNGLIEHELDHVFWGISDQVPSVDAREVMDWKYTGYQELCDHVENDPGSYTVWFRQVYRKVWDESLKLKYEPL